MREAAFLELPRMLKDTPQEVVFDIEDYDLEATNRIYTLQDEILRNAGSGDNDGLVKPTFHIHIYEVMLKSMHNMGSTSLLYTITRLNIEMNFSLAIAFIRSSAS